MNLRILALAGVAILATSAAWADDPMANTYGNTVMTKDHAPALAGSLMFNQDMTYTAKATDAKGQPVSYGGKWSLKDGGATICLTPDLPAEFAEAPARPARRCRSTMSATPGRSPTTRTRPTM